MSHRASSTELGSVQDFAALIREVAVTGEPRVIKEKGEELAVVSPVRSRRRGKRHGFDDADWNFVLAAVGGWEGIVDPEQLERDLDVARSDKRDTLEL